MHFWCCWCISLNLYPAYRPARIQMQPDRAHNDYLNLSGAAGGLITLAGAGILSPGCGAHEITSGARKNNSPAARATALRFSLAHRRACSRWRFYSLAHFNLHIPANAILGVTLLALLSSNLRFATEKYWFNLRLPSRLLLTVALLAGMGYLGAEEVGHGRETLRLARAGHLPFYSPERAAALEKSLRRRPAKFRDRLRHRR